MLSHGHFRVDTAIYCSYCCLGTVFQQSVFHNVRRLIFHHLITGDSKATIGLNALQLLAINLLKPLHSGGKVVLTECDCFDDNGNLDDEMFQEYHLIQEDGNKELMRKARIAMLYMVGQSVKQKREALERIHERPEEKSGFPPDMEY